MNGSSLALRLQLAAAAIGLAPLLLAAGALLVAALWLVALPATESARARALAELAAAQQALAQAPRGAAAPAAPAADALAEFESRLAGDEQVAQMAQQIWRQAAAAGLQLSKVDWRAEADAARRFGRVQITLPMTGSYTALRKFTFGLMAAYPSLALDKLDLKRELPAAGQVEATAHFTLFVKP